MFLSNLHENLTCMLEIICTCIYYESLQASSAGYVHMISDSYYFSMVFVYHGIFHINTNRDFNKRSLKDGVFQVTICALMKMMTSVTCLFLPHTPARVQSGSSGGIIMCPGPVYFHLFFGISFSSQNPRAPLQKLPLCVARGPIA
jgi:hypothetical protein